MFLEGARAPGTTIQTTSSILKSLAERDEERLSFGDVVKAMGSRAHGAGLLFFALPETIPIPLPGVSAFLAVPIVLIAAHLIAFGEGPGLPKRGTPPDPARLGDPEGLEVDRACARVDRTPVAPAPLDHRQERALAWGPVPGARAGAGRADSIRQPRAGDRDRSHRVRHAAA
ncbi:MAG: exopolysaccharide biosynthesis protein [Rhodospirillaceae bacterium]|nr:exopolysaccharide biosynthesis protein [Rhodospirillaceae bacterium]